MQSFDLSIGPPRRRTCKVRVGVGALELLIEDLAASPPAERLFVVADERVAPLHASRVLEGLRSRGLSAELLSFPEGEASKSREGKARIEDRMLALGAGRDAAVIAVGGGVTGDLAGFVAATWHRGIPVVQVPTSLLAMADAALGGKTAINLPAGKNLIGAFHQPLAVYADVSALSTLAEERFVEGFAEVVKSAVVADMRLFRWLEKNVESLRARDPDALELAVERCMQIKGRVVSRDEREAGRRAVLNFGHTIGHAVETDSGYTTHHGLAVAVGMCVEARVAEAVTGFPQRHAARLERVLTSFGLPVRPAAGVDAEALVRLTHRDKKVRRGEVHYSLPRELGRMLPGERVTVPVPDARVVSVVRELTGAV